ncbi:MAG: MCE family protein, partial [Micromonosporaceae bacterium]
LRSMLVSTADMADHTRFFLDRHGARIIQLGEVSAPVTNLLARFSPEFPCLTRGLVEGGKTTGETFHDGRLNITLEIAKDQGKYEKGADEPPQNAGEWPNGKYGPNCFGLPNPQTPFPPWEPDGTGYDWGRDRGPASHLPVSGSQGRTVDDALLTDPTMGYAGSEEEQAMIKPLVAAATDTPVTEVGDLSVLLWGPLMRGAVVNAR